MQIVIVSDFAETNGGAAKVAVTSARGLAEADVAVTYVCGSAPVSPVLSHPRIDVRCLDLADVWRKRNPLAAAQEAIWYRRARTALEEILADLPADETVVHFHQWTKAFSPSVLSVPVRRGLPSVVSLHDYFLVCPNGAYYRYAHAAPCERRPMSLSCVASRCDRMSYAHKAVRVLRQAATARAVQGAGATMSVLNVTRFAAEVVDPFIAKDHARFTVRSPVDVERGSPVPVTENNSFVFAGRLTEEKGVRLLAEAARDAALELTICGDGPLLAELRRLGPPIECTGWLDAAALSAALRHGRALVFPSTWYETGGLVVAEALAQGIPVIASRSTGAAAWIENGVNGFLIEPGDASALRAAMMALTDDDIARWMSERAYELYWAKPSNKEAHTEQLLAVYREVLAQHRSRNAQLPAGSA